MRALIGSLILFDSESLTVCHSELVSESKKERLTIMAKFAKGMNVKAIETKYGELLKIGINVEKIKENPTKNDWLNVTIKRGKNTNKPYLEIDNFKPDKKEEQSEGELIQTEDKDLEDDFWKESDLEDEEVPF